MRALAFIAAILCSVSCTTALSGPLRTVPLESVATVEPDHGSIGVSAGAHTNAVGHAGARGRIGVAHDVDVGGEGSWITFGDPIHGNQYGIGHGDVRHRVHDNIAFMGGLGLGGGSYGLYGGPDLGVVFAYENPEIVPFFALRIGLSVPLLPTPHVTTTTTPSGETMTNTIDVATTLYMQPTLGFRIPVRLDDIGHRVDLLLGACFTAVSLLDHGGGMGGTFGGELGIDFFL